MNNNSCTKRTITVKVLLHEPFNYVDCYVLFGLEPLTLRSITRHSSVLYDTLN